MFAMRNFSARETEWLQELDGIELAPFWRRATAILLDATLIAMLRLALSAPVLLLPFLMRVWMGHPMPVPTDVSLPSQIFGIRLGTSTVRLEEVGKVMGEALSFVTTLLYFGVLTWKGKGRTPGKWLFKIRVVSLVHRHLSLWHAIERALGYGAAALEGGFGFVQFFIHPYRRCVQDRIAETIIVTERGYQQMQTKAEHRLLPDEGNIAESHVADETLPTTN